ncbi:MAG: hypothetical protein ACK533_07085, partial [Planctomycetota bacterium]
EDAHVEWTIDGVLVLGAREAELQRHGRCGGDRDDDRVGGGREVEASAGGALRIGLRAAAPKRRAPGSPAGRLRRVLGPTSLPRAGGSSARPSAIHPRSALIVLLKSKRIHVRQA